MPVNAHTAVRRLPRLPRRGRRSGDIEQAGRCTGAPFYARVDGIGYGHSVDVEPIEIDIGLKWRR
jgi:hypothetical protein